MRLRDPSGLVPFHADSYTASGNILVGGGVSLAALSGGEASVAVVANTAKLQDLGLVGSFGPSIGLNISGDIYVGVVPGDIGNVSGATFNLNYTVGPLSLTLFYDEHGTLVGGTFGAGPSLPIPVMASASYSNTGILVTVGDLLDFIRKVFASTKSRCAGQ
jgi:hypothetical protein